MTEDSAALAGRLQALLVEFRNDAELARIGHYGLSADSVLLYLTQIEAALREAVPSEGAGLQALADEMQAFISHRTGFPTVARVQTWVDRLRAALQEAPRAPQWQPIETAPRDSSRVLIYCKRADGPGREVFEAWWRMPYEGASPEQCWWCYDGNGTMLSADVHRTLQGQPVGATHWMPLPSPPGQVGEAPHAHPAPTTAPPT